MSHAVFQRVKGDFAVTSESLRLGWLRRLVFEAILRRLLDLIEDAKRQLPITFYFQVGRIKGRLIIDEF